MEEDVSWGFRIQVIWRHKWPTSYAKPRHFCLIHAWKHKKSELEDSHDHKKIIIMQVDAALDNCILNKQKNEETCFGLPINLNEFLLLLTSFAKWCYRTFFLCSSLVLHVEFLYILWIYSHVYSINEWMKE